jgi:hypothetical protein
MRVAEINTAIIAASAPQYLPEYRKVERIKAEPRFVSERKQPDNYTPAEDSIEISADAKLMAGQSKAGSSQLIRDTFYHSDFSKVYRESFDESLFAEIPKHLRESVSGKNWKAEKHVKEVRGGFIVSGTNGSDYSVEQNLPENKILAKYENETVRLPGHLLSILI